MNNIEIRKWLDAWYKKRECIIEHSKAPYGQSSYAMIYEYELPDLLRAFVKENAQKVF